MKAVSEREIALSVGELVRFAAAGGDIDLRFGEGRVSASLGTAVHRRLQKAGGSLYVPEVALQNVCERGGFTFSVSGRADGIIESKEGEVTVDEIKTCSLHPKYLAPGLHAMHMAQCAVYGHFYCVSEGLPGVTLRLTYFNTAEDRTFRTEEYRTAAELSEWYSSLLDRVMPMAKAVCDRVSLRGELSAASFPYPEKREGQRDMVVESYRAICKGERLFVSAPTGIGKTVSALYPALKAIGTDGADRIFYLCAKTVTSSQAAEAAERVSAPSLRTVILSAREKMCVNKSKPKSGNAGEACNPTACRCALGHYGRLADALGELLSRHGTYTPDEIRETAARYSVCPYELSLDLSEFCSLIICDYNYVFSPRVMLRRYFDADSDVRVEPTERYVILADEAHNLVDRAREMFSAELSYSVLKSLANSGCAVSGEASDLAEAVENAVLKSVGEFEEYLLQSGEYARRGAARLESPPEEITAAAEAFCRAALFHLTVGGELLEAYYAVSAYLKIAKNADGKFIAFMSLDGDEKVCRLVCADPSGMLSKCLDRAKSSIFFSATLTPVEYYINVLSGKGSASSLVLDSPFPPENLSVTVADKFSTRFGDRETGTANLADMIAAAVGAKKGNYIAFFPSYSYMKGVYDKFVRRYPKVETVVQQSGMSEAARRKFLDSFRDDGARRVFFCVLGGLYSEGIDLVGERLIGVIVVGVGIPQISDGRNLLAEYFERAYEEGFDYAYTYPGMNRVLQAAGRVIRTDTDRGIIVLIDDRYGSGKYPSMFPKHWKNIRYVGDALSLREAVRRFCNGEDGN